MRVNDPARVRPPPSPLSQRRPLRWYLRVMGAHGSVAPEGAAGVAVAGVGEGVVFDLVVPRLHQLEDGAVPADDKHQLEPVGGGAHLTPRRSPP